MICRPKTLHNNTIMENTSFESSPFSDSENIEKVEKIKERHFNILEDRIKEYKDFYSTEYATKVENVPAEKQEQYTIKAEEIEKILNQLRQNPKTEIAGQNHFSHIMGNLIPLLLNTAERHKKGKNIPAEKIAKAKENLEILNYYLNEIYKDPELLSKELKSTHGFLTDYMDFFKCDIPSTGNNWINVFKFFRDMETGKISKENFFERAEEIYGIVDVEQLYDNLYTNIK